MDVTCLVPAFKHRYFEHLLISLRTQSRPPERIVISDDSPGGDFLTASRSDRLRPLIAAMPIEIVQGPRQGHHRNIEQLLTMFQKAPTSHFHILNDDDMIYPEFYAHHAAVSKLHNPLCSVVRRWVANDHGVPIGFGWLPDSIAAADQAPVAVLPKMIVDRFETPGGNWLGELSFGVFRSDFLQAPDAFCVHDGFDYTGLNDLGSFIKVSLTGTLIFSNHYLGAFRRSPAGLSRQRGHAFSLSVLAMIPLSLLGFEHRLLDLDRLTGLIAHVRGNWIGIYGENAVIIRLARMIALVERHGYPGLREDFLEFWRWYRTDIPGLRSCATAEDLGRLLI